MAGKSVRVLVRGARLSFPDLLEPRAPAEGVSGDPKYGASFILDPQSASAQELRKAIVEVAVAAYGADAGRRMADAGSDKQPLRRGDDRVKIPMGYAGKVVLSAKSKTQPELRDANRALIRNDQDIRSKFVPGYRVNAVVDIYPVLKPGIPNRVCAGLVAVQFAGYDEAFGGGAPLDDSAFPDESAAAAASGIMDVPPVRTDDIPF